jgi:hypothetical protein
MGFYSQLITSLHIKFAINSFRSFMQIMYVFYFKTCNEEMSLELQNRFMVALPEMFKTFNVSIIQSNLSGF